MGRDSFIHLVLKRPQRRGSEMSTWRGRLRDIDPLAFPEKKRKHSSSASTVPEACSDRRRRQVERRGRDRGRMLGPLIHSLLLLELAVVFC